jgi:hypothetical protein
MSESISESNTESNYTLVNHKHIFSRLFIATLALLMIPLIAMQFTEQVNWSAMDFLVMGALLFGMSSFFILVARRIAEKYRVALFGLVLLGFLYIWAELAVGIFT